MKYTCNCKSCRGEGPDDDDVEVPIKVINEWIDNNRDLIGERMGILYIGKTLQEFNAWLNKHGHKIYDEFENEIVEYYAKQIQSNKEDEP